MSTHMFGCVMASLLQPRSCTTLLKGCQQVQQQNDGAKTVKMLNTLDQDSGPRFNGEPDDSVTPSCPAMSLSSQGLGSRFF